MTEVLDSKSSIKVLHYFAFPGGGIGRYVHELLTEMQRQPSIDVELACIPSFESLSAATYQTWPKLLDITHPVPLLRRLRFAINLVINPVRAIRRARASGIQILHLSTIPHVTFAYWSRYLRSAHIRLVATAHDVRRYHGLFHLGYELEQLRRLYRTCDALFVHSEYQKRDLIDFAGVNADRIYVVPHGPYYYGPPSAPKDELRRRYGIPLDKQVALFFGDIRPDKNLDLFLKAMVPYKDQLFLIVAGRAKGANARPISLYQELANSLGIQEACRFLGSYVPSNEVADLFALADWVALPYARTFTSQSGVLAIALAYQRPVLVAGTGTMPETARRLSLGVVVEPDSEFALRQGIQEMIGSIERRKPWYQTRNCMIPEVSWARNACVTSRVYRKLINEAFIEQ